MRKNSESGQNADVILFLFLGDLCRLMAVFPDSFPLPQCFRGLSYLVWEQAANSLLALEGWTKQG